jgi:putative restriction endonuclease
MKLVLDTKPDSAYNDEIAHRYHFPPRYLQVVQSGLNDWAVFRRPRAAGEGIAYFAVGRISGIVPDFEQPGYHYALIDDYLPFNELVPWRVNARYAEAALREIRNVPQVGLYLRGKSVRQLLDTDFEWIVANGLSQTLKMPNLEIPNYGGVATENSISDESPKLEQEQGARRITTMLVNRKVRDRSFRLAICTIYNFQCAFTGLQIYNYRNYAEVQAAHIQSVSAGGPDIVQNGIALCSTAHWLFDNHLISLTDDYRVILSPHVPPRFAALIIIDKPVHLPLDSRLWPSKKYIADHRRQFLSVGQNVQADLSM